MNCEDRRILHSLNKSDFIIIIVKNLFFFKKTQHFSFSHSFKGPRKGIMGRTCSIGKKLIDFRMVHRAEIQTPIDSRNIF